MEFCAHAGIRSLVRQRYHSKQRAEEAKRYSLRILNPKTKTPFTHAKSPHSDLVKEELVNMLPPSERHVDDSNQRRVVENLAKRISINTVSNRCLSSFVLANLSVRLPKAFIDSYGLKRIKLTPQSSTGMSFEYPYLSDVLYQSHEHFSARELHAIEWN